MSLVFESQAIKGDPTAAATHVLLIGCGEYPSIAKAGYGSLKPLSSPRLSVDAIANWFLTGVDALPAGQAKDSSEAFFNSEAPLGSLAMLTSPNNAFATPFGSSITPTRPTIANIRAAYLAWLERVALNPGSRGVFYYCGHGVSDGLTQYLVADDLGEDLNNTWDAVFHLTNTLQASIRKARASLFYFIDACMELSEEMINQIDSPRALLGGKRTGTPTTNEWAILRATTANRVAYAPEGGVAKFTAALLAALKGHCGLQHPSGNGYGVGIASLREAISAFLEFEQPDAGDDRQKVGATEGDGTWTVPMHIQAKRPSILLELDVVPLGFRPVAQAFMEDTAQARDIKPLAVGPAQFVREQGEWTYGANSTDSTSFPEQVLSKQFLTQAAFRRRFTVSS
ncbi:caspase family protein [Mesorhizobium kowhaii]|uniref:caspase family protein n=1 Tax=Mesorhizobium kowhaii TaxID=1300272 RepID=UPI0035E8DF33